MTNYQTTVQHPGYIRWGSAKIDVWDATNSGWVNLGALKGISATTTTDGLQEFQPDNAPTIKRDPTPKTWDWTAELQEAWNPAVLKLLRGNIDTYATGASDTTIGVYAGTGSRPYNKFRITNTTAGASAVVIVINKAKVTSELDWTFPTDIDGTTALALPLTFSGEIDGNNGFGTIVVPNEAGAVTISPQSVSIAVGATQTMTITGATNKSFGTTDVAVATVSSLGVVTGVAAGTCRLLIDCDGVTYIIPVTVTSA